LASGPARELTAFVTHLDHVFEGTRLWQIRGVLQRLARHDFHFLVGDFNTPGFLGAYSRYLLPPVLRRLREAGYRDAFDVAGRGPGRTFPAHSPLVRIDFLFLPNRWAHGLRSARTLDRADIREASDHRPVVVEWTWPAPAPV
jgi:endonuclease/exonuclease/phosphatase family metal-dependent hydrolase